MKLMKKNQIIIGMAAMLAIGTCGALAADAGNIIINTDAVPQSKAMLLVAAVTPLIIAVLKLLVPKIPPAALPIVAPIVGALVDLLLGGQWGQGTILAAIAGSAGVGLREIVDQLKKLAAQNTEKNDAAK